MPRAVLATATQLGDPQSLGNAHLALAFTWENQGDLAQAAAAFAEVMALWHGTGASEVYVSGRTGATG